MMSHEVKFLCTRFQMHTATMKRKDSMDQVLAPPNSVIMLLQIISVNVANYDYIQYKRSNTLTITLLTLSS